MNAKSSIENQRRRCHPILPLKTWLLLTATLLAFHLLLTTMIHVKHFPAMDSHLGLLEGKPLHVISAYPRVPLLPGVLVMGAKGSGVDVVSSWLASSKGCHGQIPSKSNINNPNQKDTEVHFFDKEHLYLQGSKFYSGLYQHCQHQNNFVFDATPETILYPDRVYNIYSSVPGRLDESLRIIVLVREPLSRQYYLHNQNTSQAMSFDQYAQEVLRPQFTKRKLFKTASTDIIMMHPSDILPLWTKYFSRKQILVLSYDELEYNRQRFMWRVQQYLGQTLNRTIIVDDVGNEQARQISNGAKESVEALYWAKNKELYWWLNANQGPVMEQIPFLEFEVANSEEKVLPNVLLIGAQFSGVSLISDLLFHNKACGPAIFNDEKPMMAKQAFFFDTDDRYNQGIDFYAKRYKHCLIERNTDLIVDGTPNYLTYHKRVHDIYQQASDENLAKLKMIIVLREPISREKKVYQYKRYEYNRATDKKQGWFRDILDKEGGVLSFEQYAETALIEHIGSTDINLASEGRYVDHLRKWFEYFPRHQFLILSHDEMENDPKSVQTRIEKFLGQQLTGSLGKTPNDGGVSKRARDALSPLFDLKNNELYEFLKTHSGPSMEQIPFPPFKVQIDDA